MIKFLIPELLYFDTGHIVDGKQIGRGYYFKGKFISQYKSLMMENLRAKFKNDFSDENKKKFADEWKVIHYFSEISTRAVKKTNEKKKPYYKEFLQGAGNLSGLCQAAKARRKAARKHPVSG